MLWRQDYALLMPSLRAVRSILRRVSSKDSAYPRDTF